MKISFLGPEASFSQLTTSVVFPNEELIPQPGILDCFRSVISGESEKAVVPLENSIEGTVSMTLDYLYDFDVKIEAEVVLPVSHQLMIHPDNDTFTKVYSHPQALAQCFHFLENHYKTIERKEFASTAAAAKRVSENPHEKYAAIANTYAAKRYGLKIIHENIQDFEQNHTKFIVISKSGDALQSHLSRISEKTSLLITLPDDHAGGLHQVLSVFAWRKMNLSKIESRTMKTGLGKYFFFINVANNQDSELFDFALQELKALDANVKFVGHYQEYYIEE
ncbi:MAG: prephenate dehydratase [Bergeyella sp.]